MVRLFKGEGDDERRKGRGSKNNCALQSAAAAKERMQWTTVQRKEKSRCKNRRISIGAEEGGLMPVHD